MADETNKTPKRDTKTTEFHPLVQLLLSRMESHPEEFEKTDFDYGRWHHFMEVVDKGGTQKEKAVIATKFSLLMMDAAHKRMMDELLNGEERRAKEEQEQAEYKRLYQQTKMQQLAAQQLAAQQQQQYQNLYGQLGAAGIAAGIAAATPPWVGTRSSASNTTRSVADLLGEQPEDTGFLTEARKAPGL